MSDARERKRLRASAPVAWDFLSPWFEQVKGRLVATSDGYVQVLDPSAQNRESDPKQYTTNDWRTREALELLVLVHSVNNRAWVKILLERCALRFDEEEDSDDDSNTPAGNGTSPYEEMFRFECERDREVPSPRFRFRMEVGNQKPGELSPVTKWRHFFLSHTSGYGPSEEFLEARRRILTMQDEAFLIHPRVPRSIEIPVSLDVGTGIYRQENAEFVGHMWELRKLIDDMRRYHTQQVSNANAGSKSIRDCARSFAYRLDLLSLLIFRVDMTEACVESVLRVLGTGIPIGELELNLFCGDGVGGSPVTRAALAKFLTGLLVEPLDPSLKIHSIDAFVYTASVNWHCEALCSTLAVARTPVGKLEIFGSVTRRKGLKLLAQALFFPHTCRRTSYPSIHGLDISYSELDRTHLIDFAITVREKVMTWQVRRDTSLHFEDTTDGAIVTKHAISIPIDTNRELLLANVGDHDDTVEVALPGYGKCQVPRIALVTDDGIAGRPSDAGNEGAESISSLSIHFFACAEILETLLGQVGWSLRNLMLEYSSKMDDEVMMAAILKWCPKMTSLSFRTHKIDLNRVIATYEQFGGETKPAISSLSLLRVDNIGSDHGVSFATVLGDPTSRLARHLEKLTITIATESTAVKDSTLQALWMALKNNTSLKKLSLIVEPGDLNPWGNRFRQFHGQVLPPIPLNLPSKLAFISAKSSGGGNSLHAFQHLDQRLVSLVFEFAATRVIRSVTMLYLL